jgi:recombinational DNA repair protein RecR
MQGVRELFHAKLEETREQARRLMQLERDLAESLAYLEDCRVCDESSTSACVSCEHESAKRNQPALVSGLHLTRMVEQNSGAPT